MRFSVGPNGSGKSAFLDVVHFLGDFVRYGLDAAIQRRSPTFQELVWRRDGNMFRLAVDAANPEGDRQSSYDLSIALDGESGIVVVREESATLPDGRKVSGRIARAFRPHALGEAGPELAWVTWALADVRLIRLEPRALAEPSPPERESDMVNSGASLAWQIRRLQERSPRAFEDWISHLRTALPMSAISRQSSSSGITAASSESNIRTVSKCPLGCCPKELFVYWL